MVQEIAIGMLVPHPETCNYMTKESLVKLRRSIEFTGCYEPLVVRRHVQEPGKFQIIHGHHRLRVLKAMGHLRVKCAVWDLDDEQTRVYLAVMNRVSGSDIPERRAMLLEQLLQRMTIEDLAALVPDKKRVLEELEALATLEADALTPVPTEQADKQTAPVILHCMMESTGAKSVDLALDLIIQDAGGELSRGKAMAELAKRFLQQCMPGEAAHEAADQRFKQDTHQAMAYITQPAPPQGKASLHPLKGTRKQTTKRQPLRVQAK